MSSPHQTLNDNHSQRNVDFYHNPLAQFEPQQQEQQFREAFVSKVGELVARNQQRPKWDPTLHDFPLYEAPSLYYVKGDDAAYSLTWKECLRSCALFAFSPLASDKIRMKRKLQARYTHLFEDGSVPPLDNQKTLLLWACEQRGKQLAKQPEQKVEDVKCNYDDLMKQFGPNKEQLKRKLNHIPGLL